MGSRDTTRIKQREATITMKKRLALLNARKATGKTQREAAIALDISEIYLRKLEAGTVAPGRNILLRIERFYGTSMRELFSDIFSLPETPTASMERDALTNGR